MLLGGIAAEAGEPPVETTVSIAVENFEPLWSPPARELRGWVVGIDPGGVSPSQPRQRLCDDLSLVTAVHLYHLVLAAGGSPVLTRVDDTRAVDPERSAWERRIDVIGRAGCNLCVSIRCDEAAGKVVVRAGAVDPRPDDALLAEALGAALGVEPAGPSKRRSGDASFIEALRQAEGSAGIALCEVRFGFSPEEATVPAPLRKVCFSNARRLYAGISRFCRARAKRADLSAEPSPIPQCPSSSTDDRLKRLGRSIWPRGRLPDEQVDWFCRRFTELSVTNRSLVYLEVSATREQEVIVLRGRTNAPQVAAGLEQALRGVGVEHIRSELQTLPSRERLGEELFGVCRVPMALTYDQPGDSGGLQTQLLFGEPLFLLDQADEYYLLHAADGYWGWVGRAAIQPVTAEQFDAYVRQPRGSVLQDIDNDRARIPRGSRVPVARVSADERDILLPDGSTLSVPAAVVMMLDTESSRAAARVRAALDLLYAPYVFGGRSPLGLDCSGLVTNVWARTGGGPSRDAWQQAFAGRLVATRWHRAGIQPGDQLFFINEGGKIYHTAVALDADHFLHAAPPCVQISSLNPQDPLYDPERAHDFFLAKRP